MTVHSQALAHKRGTAPTTNTATPAPAPIGKPGQVYVGIIIDQMMTFIPMPKTRAAPQEVR